MDQHAARTPTATLRPRDASVARPVAGTAGWSDLDVRAVDTIRLLAADAVQKAIADYGIDPARIAPVLR